MSKKPLQLKETKAGQVATADMEVSKNPRANSLPTEGHYIEVDGKLKSHYKSLDEASKAALELKMKYPNIRVNVYDAKARTRTLIGLPK